MKKYSMSQMVDWKIQLFTLSAELLLFVRVIVRFFNGNPDAQFVHWVIGATNVLLEPFRAVFNVMDVPARGWVVDYPALFAMAVYGMAAVWFMNFYKKSK